MKKLMLAAVLALISTACMSQVTFGIQGGANLAMGKLHFDDAYFSPATVSRQRNQVNFGFKGGFVAMIPIASKIAFRPEINFLQQGTKYTSNSNFGPLSDETIDKVNLNYIQVPLNVVFKAPAGAGFAYFGLGPSLEIGLSGKIKSSSTGNNDQTTDVKFDGKKIDDLDPGDNDAHLKRFDVAANAVAGYQLGMGLFFNLSYSHGFINLNPDKDDSDPANRGSYRNSGLSLTVGYAFGGSGMSKKK